MAHLAGVDAVVNTVGILREHAGQSFARAHEAPVELFEPAPPRACARWCRSRLGADSGRARPTTAANVTADDVLRSLPLGRAPSSALAGVRGPVAAARALFNKLAVAPLLVLRRAGACTCSRCTRRRRGAGASVRLVEEPPLSIATLAFADPATHALARVHQRSCARPMGEPPGQWLLAMPGAIPHGCGRCRPAAGQHARCRHGGHAAGRQMRPGNALPELLQRPPRAPGDFRAGTAQRELLRRAAVINLWQPVLRVALALLWLWTAIVSFGLYPVADSYRLLSAQVGLQERVSVALLRRRRARPAAWACSRWPRPHRGGAPAVAWCSWH